MGWIDPRGFAWATAFPMIEQARHERHNHIEWMANPGGG
jgi:hypothetical protein